MKQKNFTFPDVEKVKSEIVAVGIKLSPSRILQAYRSGIFPWFEEDNCILWWAPNKRMVIKPEDVKISHSLVQTLKKKNYSIKIDENFADVVQHCATIARKNQSGSWITESIKKNYNRLHQMGYAHSVEVHQAGKLVSGLYGLALGKIFCGESMFSLDNSSKIAFIFLSVLLKKQKYHWIDCQVYTSHMKSLGAKLVSKKKFQKILHKALEYPDDRKNWSVYADQNLIEKMLIKKNKIKKIDRTNE